MLRDPGTKLETLTSQIVNFDSDELYEELNPSAESESSEEERDHRHMFHGPMAGRRRRRDDGGTQERKRRRRPGSNSHFLVGGDKVGDVPLIVELGKSMYVNRPESLQVLTSGQAVETCTFIYLIHSTMQPNLARDMIKSR